MSQQTLPTGEIDEPGVPRIDPNPGVGLLASLPAGFAAPGLVDAEYPDGLGLGE
ncbi:hypothetical protein [Prescottella equi]